VPQDEGSFRDSDVLFSGSSRQTAATATLDMKRIDGVPTVTRHESGHTGLRLFKITGSSFTRFVRDEHTTLPERSDRPLFIYMDVYWTYRAVEDAFGEHAHRYVPAEQVHDVCAAVFAEFNSESIQHLVHEMGLRLLDRFPQLAEVRFVAQNRTRDPFFASETVPEVKVYSDPFPAYGLITLRMTRGEDA
jgi:urate oxidase